METPILIACSSHIDALNESTAKALEFTKVYESPLTT